MADSCAATKDEGTRCSSIFQFVDIVRRGDVEGGDKTSFTEQGGTPYYDFYNYGAYDDLYEYGVDGENGHFLRRRCLPEGEEDAAEAEAGDQVRAQG